MPKVVFLDQFRFSPNGYDVVTYESSDEGVEVSEECAGIAIEIGRARPANGSTTSNQAPRRRGGKA